MYVIQRFQKWTRVAAASISPHKIPFKIFLLTKCVKIILPALSKARAERAADFSTHIGEIYWTYAISLLGFPFYMCVCVIHRSRGAESWSTQQQVCETYKSMGAIHTDTRVCLCATLAANFVKFIAHICNHSPLDPQQQQQQSRSLNRWDVPSKNVWLLLGEKRFKFHSAFESNPKALASI